jgi:hypothetical protein
MYDTVKISTFIQDDISPYLNNMRELVNRKTGEVFGYEGDLNGIRVKDVNDKLTIEGSFPKYYFGNNFMTMNFEQSKEVLESLSENLHCNISEAAIQRIDFADNFDTSAPPLNYYPCLIESSKLNRNLINNSLYFQNRQRTLIFYDKTKEYQDKKKVIPDEYLNKNVLRYERRLTKAITGKLKVKDLFNANYFNMLLNGWKKDYDSIYKIPSIEFSKEYKMVNFKTLEKEALKLLILEKFGSIESFFQVLDNEQRKGVIRKQNKRYLKMKFIKACQQPELIKGNDLIAELDEKIIETYQQYLV